MKDVLRRLARPDARPYVLLVLVVVVFALLQPNFLSSRSAFSVFQHFSTIGLIALGLGLTMIMREFDLSVAGMMSLGGCVGVLCGNESALLGVVAAMALGALIGLIQSGFVIRLGLSSVAVSLGGLLTCLGLAYVLTGNQTVPFNDMDMAIAINAPVLPFISLRASVVLVVFVVAGLVMAYTRLGRDLIAAGSNRHASVVAGAYPDRILAGVFALSGALAALAGAMLSFGLSSASPSGGVADILVPAVAAAILGGVSLSGGMGRPMGIAAGVLILCVLRTGLTLLGIEPFLHDVVTGAILLVVAIADGTSLRMRWHQLKRLVSGHAGA